MNIKTTRYQTYLTNIPDHGRHILGQQTEEHILVYQAFNPRIAEYALEHQRFGGPHYSMTRMSWIKPNFLWMMFRCGWAEKPQQERVLGIWMTKTGFSKILEEAVYSSYQEDIYGSRTAWQAALAHSNVRLQWDPDHDVYGNKQKRRAVQLGLKGETLHAFNDTMIRVIVDMTPFVKEQKALLDAQRLTEVQVPEESLFRPESAALQQRLFGES